MARTTLTLGAILLAAATAHGAATTVREPAFGLPHIFADTDAELARENGAQIARDRLAQLILLSRVGRGTLYQAFGALNPNTLNDDIAARRTAYTSSELNNMYQKLPQRERDAILEYCKGVNDTIDAIYAGALPEPLEVDILRNVLGLSSDLFGNQMNISDQFDPYYQPPGGAWPNAGFQFTPEMAMSIAVLEVRNFGLGGFDEVALLQQLQALVGRHGPVSGTEIWDDLNFLNDPLAPITVPDPTTPGYGGPLARLADPAAAARYAAHFPRFDYGAGLGRLKEEEAERARFAMSLGAWPMLGSYAWVIGGSKSATGYPWLGGFPQTGIQTPSLMHFVENLSAEGTTNRIRGLGMEFAGAPLVLIGQTDTVAYTSTTAQLRVLDTVLEEVVSENSNVLHYLDHAGVSKPLNMRVETFLGGLAPTATRVFWRSHETGGNNGARAIFDFLGDKEGTADSGGASTLVDAGMFDASFVGGHVAIVDGTGAGQIRAIGAVPDANTLTVGMAWATPPDNTSVYVAVRPGNPLTAAAFDSSVWLEESTTALGFGLMQRADSILDVRAAARLMPSTHNFPAADNLPHNGIGAVLGNGNIGYWSSGFSRRRQGGLDPRLPIDGSGSPNPLVKVSGKVSTAGPTSLTAVGTPFSTNFAPPPVNFRYDDPTQQGREYIVVITSGTGYRQSRRVAGNTANTLTVEYPWGVIPAPNDTFELSEIVAIPEAINPTEGYMANWNNKAATADEGNNFGRQFRHIFILERLAAENAWDRSKQRQLNEDVAGLDGKGDFGRYLIPRLREAVDAVGNGGSPAVDTVLAALETHQGPPFLGRNFIDPVTATMAEGEVAFLNSFINQLAQAIYGDELAGTGVPVPTGSRALNTAQHAIDSKAGDVAGSYGQAYHGNYFAPFDHFMCYRTRTTPGTPRFGHIARLLLTTAVEAREFDVVKPVGLCPPASKDDEALIDAATHLESYVIRDSGGQAPAITESGVVVQDQFGTLTVDTGKRERLLVPTGKNLDAPASLPPAGLDHFLCEKVRVRSGFQAGATHRVRDQFEDRVYELRRPVYLCSPVDKAGSGINRPDSYLMCYRVRRAFGEPRHTRVTGRIYTKNQFGEERLDTRKERDLCVPALKNPGSLRGWEVTVRDSLKAAAAGGIPADTSRPNSTYAHPLSAFFPSLVFPPTPAGNRGTYEQIVDVGPVVNGEFMFPLGQSGHIEGSFAGVTFIDPNVTSLHPIWRDWRFVPILHVAQDLTSDPDGDTDGDGVLDGFERWYYGNLAQGAASDTDSDGASLLEEFTDGSDPTDADTDDDAILDGADGKPQDRLLP
jgi:hypothetical protein